MVVFAPAFSASVAEPDASNVPGTRKLPATAVGVVNVFANVKSTCPETDASAVGRKSPLKKFNEFVGLRTTLLSFFTTATANDPTLSQKGIPPFEVKNCPVV